MLGAPTQEVAMHGSSSALTHDAYIEALDEPRRSDVRVLHDLIRSTVPELEPTMAFGILGYGTYHYRYASGREGDSTIVGLASNKRHLSLYVACAAERDLADTYGPRLPKASIGKGCIRVRRAADLDLDVVAELLREAAAHPPGEPR
jgi:uncharacterized protein YdhG (YjbR/CyaY superfamily)